MDVTTPLDLFLAARSEVAAHGPGVLRLSPPANLLASELMPRLVGCTNRLLGHAHDAEDATQETGRILAQLMQIPVLPYKFKGNEEFEALVFTIACRAAFAIRRKRRPGSIDPSDALLTELLDPFSEELSPERADDVRRVLEAFSLIGETQRRLLERVYILGLTGADIARMEGIHERTMLARIARARQQLRAELTRIAPQLAARWEMVPPEPAPTDPST